MEPRTGCDWVRYARSIPIRIKHHATVHSFQVSSWRTRYIRVLMPLSVRTWLYRRNSRHSCLTNSAPDYVYCRNCFASLIRFGSRTPLSFELNRGFGEFNGCSLRLPAENWKIPGTRFWLNCFADEPRSLLGSNFFLWRERAKCHHDSSSYIFSFSTLYLQHTPSHNPPSHPLKHAPTTNKSKISQNITPLPKTKL